MTDELNSYDYQHSPRFWLGLSSGRAVLDASRSATTTLASTSASRLKGNLLRLADGHFVAEKGGELFRLTPEAQFERKLDFAPDRPLAGITGAETYFWQLVAPRNDGGFLANVTFYIPGLGWLEQRLASFDADGRLISSIDTYGTYISAAVELPDNRLLYASEHGVLTVHSADGANYNTLAFGGSAPAVAFQGSNVIVAGNLANLSGPPNPGQTNGLWRLTDELIPDGSFRPPRCKDIDQLAIQSDGRIIARGRLANAQGVFESDTSVFRMNADGTFERSFIRGPADCCPPPLTFSVATNDEIIILNVGFRSDTEMFLNAFSRYRADGTLAESGILEGEFYWFDAVESLPDGSFLAHWYFGADAGGGCLRSGSRNHWVGFRPNGSVNPSFPPAPLDIATINISISNMQAGHTYIIEQSSDLIHWQDAVGDSI